LQKTDRQTNKHGVKTLPRDWGRGGLIYYRIDGHVLRPVECRKVLSTRICEQSDGGSKFYFSDGVCPFDLEEIREAATCIVHCG